MKNKTVSITRRLVLTVLLLELAAGVALVAVVALNVRHNQYSAFDATLRGDANGLMSAVQEGDHDNVLLDLRDVRIPARAVYSVKDNGGRILGSSGTVPDLDETLHQVQNARVGKEPYRFFVLHGERIIDSRADGGAHHAITIVYGLPSRKVWHEVLEAVQFFSVATIVLLSITALAMAWLVRRSLQPIHELAFEADKLNAFGWNFTPPESAQRTNELRPLSVALETALARLKRSFEQQRRFTNDAAHELKTDLAIVKSSMQLLSIKKRSVEEYERGLALCLDDFTRLEITVQKMLTLARLEQVPEDAGQSCLLHEAIDEAVAQSRSFAELKHITVRVDSARDLLVPLDKRDALLLCSNLLMNALQHSGDRSAVEIGLEVASEQAMFTVRDHGEGLREEDMPFLFEPFYRGDSSRSRKTGGTGLGLSICKAICDRIGGSITLANAPVSGALVTVTLPFAIAQQPQETLSHIGA